MYSILKQTFIFSHLTNEDFDVAISKITPTVKSFKRDEVIFSQSLFSAAMGIILSGRCIVRKAKSQGEDVPLNVLTKTDSFGVISVLSEREEFPTEIIAVENSEIIFISKRDIWFLIENYPEISQSFIRFLSDKIVFLNDKISTFSAYNVEQKLSNYLLQLSKKTNDTTLVFSKSAASRAINSSRASLYRAIDALSEKGIINLDGKKIIITDPLGLERNSK